MIFQYLMVVPFIIGFFSLVFCLGLMLPWAASPEDEKSYLEKIIVALFVNAIICLAISLSTMGYDSYCGLETNNIGVGTVVRLNNSVGKHSVTTHTIVKLKGINYTCYGYVPDVKEVAVIEIKRRLTGLCSYTCELSVD